MHREQAQRQKGLFRISQSGPAGCAELVFVAHGPGSLIPGMAKGSGKVASTESSWHPELLSREKPCTRLSQTNPLYPRTMPHPSLPVLLSGQVGEKQPSYASPPEARVYFGLRKINMKEERLVLATVMEMLVHS